MVPYEEEKTEEEKQLVFTILYVPFFLFIIILKHLPDMEDIIYRDRFGNMNLIPGTLTSCILISPCKG